MLALLMLGSMAFLGEHVGQTFESPPTSTPPGLPDGRTAEELDRSIAEAAARLNRSLANKRAVDDEDKEEIARLFRERERLRDQREAASASPPPAAGPTIEEIDRSLAEVERRLRQALAARRNSAEEDMHLRLRRELDELQLRREAALEAEKAEARRRTEALERQLAEQRQMLIAVVTGAAIVVVLGLAMFWLRQRTRAAIADDAPPRMAASAEPPPEVLVGEMLFVSYAHRDFARVDPIVSEIEALGKAVWIDRRGMVGGPGWAGQITRAIKGSRAVLLMASPSAYASDQVVRELYLAMGAKKAIVPIEIEPASMPDELEYILAGRQRHAVSAGDAREVLARALDRL
jgi:hypothetical protein